MPAISRRVSTRPPGGIAVLFVTSWLGWMAEPHAAHAQWTIINLHPPTGAGGGSVGYGGFGARQVGVVLPTTHPFDWQATLWNGAAATPVTLHPLFSHALGASETQQVGFAAVGSRRHASLWTGTATSWVDLHPAGALESEAQHVHAGQQVGWADFGSDRAGIWQGTAASWVDLSGGATSRAYACHGGQQVGYAHVGGRIHASLWSGTAASRVDLHPSGQVHSHAYGIHDGQQVGWVYNTSNHASLWRGDAASWVDLHPAVANASQAVDVHDGVQVGWADLGGVLHASLWSGDAASWEDLSLALSGSWRDTSANAIWSDGTTIYVLGGGFNNATLRQEALLWMRPVAAHCAADCDGSGALDFFDFLCFQNLFAAADPRADCDASTTLDFFDFLCFQNAFAAGCP